MKNRNRTLLPMAAAALAVAAAAPARAASLPSVIAPPAHESLTLSVAARGVEIYECRLAQGGAGAEWAFVAPEAELYDGNGRRVGRHGAGPSWRFDDGSHVTGRVSARVDAPQARAIPWLLLSAEVREPQGRLAHVRSIRRVNTVGGVAPADGCSTARLGSVRRVPYTADYHFHGSR